MKGATTATAGSAGLVPAPAKSYNTRFLRGDGIWADPVLTGVGNIKYDQSDDWIKIYYNDGWQNWKKAGFIWDFYLYKNGNNYSDYTGGYYISYTTGTSGTYSLIENSSGYLKFTRSGEYASAKNGVVSTREKIDLTNFKQIHVIGKITGTNTNSGNYINYFGLATTNDATVDTITSLDSVASNKHTTVSFDKYLDISSYSGEYCFTIYQSKSSSGGWLGYIEISSIQLIQ